MTKIYCGTSGWSYEWNIEGTLDWYIQYSELNSIELNSSFYRFPFPNQVLSWKRKTESLNPELKWSIKVNRFVTHVFKFNERALKIWKKFEKLFSPLEQYIDFYLFQLPPNLKPNSFSKLERFIKKVELNEKLALEVRNPEWFNDRWIKWATDLGITWVSVDAPDFSELPREIYCTNGIVYLRMHGRTDWYSHHYTDEELNDVAWRIKLKNPEKVYVFMNNNSNMLENGRSMKRILEDILLL